jgi:hypothetical protein
MQRSVKEILGIQTSVSFPQTGIEEHRKWILSATDEQLDEYISETALNPHVHPFALAERQKRHFKHLSKPHWTTTPVFIVGFFAMVFAGIASWPVIQGWIRSSQPANKDASSQPQQSNSVPAKPKASQIVPPATNAAQSTNLLNK